ncbi:MAG: hypothetical protein Fues2KO_09550 [Fuerstiella sp.]
MPQQPVHPSDEQLTAYDRGLLSPDEAVVIEAHISDCEPCCETIVSLSADDTFIGLLKDARPQPADRTTAGLQQDDATISTDADWPAEIADLRRYKICRLIGRGGMGDVYEAIHRRMERRVALKFINRDLFRKSEAVDRFHREVKAAAQLSHPNIVTSHDADQAGAHHFMVMEFVDGVDLSQIVKERGALPIVEASDYIRQAAMGLQHAFDRGMVHRDIKPHNLMVTADGTVKILDFGLASLAPEAQPASDSAPERSDLTAAGAIMGSPDFISPEQADDARQADIRSDIYSLGATLYYLLSGRVPFAEGSVMHKLRSHAQLEPESLKSLRSDLPDELVAIVSKMMAKDPDQRYLTPREVADAMEAFLRTWQPDDAESRPLEPSSGGNRSASSGKLSGVSDAGRDWFSTLAPWLFYIPFLPIAIWILDVFFLSDEASAAASDRVLYVYVPITMLLATVCGALAAARQLRSQKGHAGDKGMFQWTKGETLVVGLIIGAAAVLWYIQTDHGIIRVSINDPSIRVSIANHTVSMQDADDTSLTIDPGSQMLLVSIDDAGFRFHTELFEIRRGDEIAFRLEKIDDEIVVLKDGEPFDRSRIINVVGALEESDHPDPSRLDQQGTGSKSPAKSELRITEKTVNPGTAGLPSVYDWNLAGRSVGDLEVQLLLAQNGKAEVIQEFDFAELPADFASKVRLEVKDSATGSDGKRRVNAMIHVGSPVPSRSTTINEDEGLSIAVEAPFSNRIERADLAPIAPSQTELLLALSYWTGDMTHGRSLKSMTEASKNGTASFLVVTLTWSPASQNDPGGEVRKEQTAADYKNVQGTWRVILAEDSGRTGPQDTLRDIRVVITRNAFNMEVAGRTNESTYKLDPTTTPRSIDLTSEGRTTPGIYDLQGDTLRICMSEDTDQRPTAFDSQPNSINDVVLTLKRMSQQELAEGDSDESMHEGLLTATLARQLIPKAASISNEDFRKLQVNPSKTAIESQSLSLTLLTLDAGGESPVVADDFRFLVEGVPKPSVISAAMSQSRSKGYFSMIQPEYITECRIRNSTADSAKGKVTFNAPQLYIGSADFVASKRDGKWRIEQFRLPSRRITVSLREDGKWRYESED